MNFGKGKFFLLGLAAIVALRFSAPFVMGYVKNDPCLKVDEWERHGDVMYPKRTFCYEDLAAKRKDFSICRDKVTDFLSECYRSVAVAIGDPNLCKDVPLNPMWGRQEIDRWMCVGEIAKAKKDIALCDTIPSIGFFEASALCHPRFPDNRCDGISDLEEKDQCNINSAVEQRFSRPCNVGVSKKNVGRCYDAIAEVLKDPQACLSGEEGQWECLVRLVKETGSTRHCKKIPRPQYEKLFEECSKVPTRPSEK
jgi:hypothetical protein